MVNIAPNTNRILFIVTTAIVLSGSAIVFSAMFTQDDVSTETPQIVKKPEPSAIPQSIEPENITSSTSLKLFSEKITFNPIKDSFVRQGLPMANEGANDELRIIAGKDIANRIVIQFDQSEIDSLENDSVQSAFLYMYIIDNDKNWMNNSLEIYKMPNAWIEGSSTNLPFEQISGDPGIMWSCSNYSPNTIDSDCVSFENISSNSQVTDSIIVSDDMINQWIKFDVTKDIEYFLNGNPNNGWLIKAEIEDLEKSRINFASKEGKSTPYLEIIFQ